MKTYLKNIVLHYVLFYAFFSFIILIIFDFIFNSSLLNYYILFFILLLIYNILLHKKKKLTQELWITNIFIFFICLCTLSLCLLLSSGSLTSSMWYPLYIVACPFVLVFTLLMLYGYTFETMLLIAIILLTNIIIETILLKPSLSKKYACLFTIVCLCLSAFDFCYYQNIPSVKYQGHDFAYMHGYSSTDLSPFYPYNPDHQLVKLQEPSDLIIENEKDMPILDGAEACYPVYSAIALAVYKDIAQIEDQYKNDDLYAHTNGKIVSFTNSSVGYSRLINQEIDMFFGAKPSASQLEEAKEAGVEFEYTPIGQEAFVFFVNENNPISQLSSDQIKAIYHGDITNWQELGGKNAKIIAFQRPERSGSQSMMSYFMGDISLKEPITYEMQSGMGGIIKEVAEYYNEDGAIGYTFQYFLEGLHQEEHVKILSIDGVYPSHESVKNKTYPLSTYLYCVTLKSNQKENVQKLKDFLLSTQGQYIIEQTGYYSLVK